MNEKFVHVDVFVDTTDPEQLSALYSFLSKVGKNAKEQTNNAPTEPAKPAEEPAKPAEEPAKPAKPARQSRTKPASEPAKPAKEPVEAEPAEEPEAQKPETPAAAEKEYKIEEVREKLKEKVSDHREAIKSKLTELGAPNVSSLDPDKYSEFVKFLESLA